MRVGPAFSILALAAVAVSTPASGAPDLGSGRKFARTECGGCHVVVAEKGKQPPPRTVGAAPHFVAIARDPAMTEAKIRQTLRLPHGSMNNIMLTETDTANIIGYIQSLR